MDTPTSFKLPIRAWRKHLPALPGQDRSLDYGIVWDACPIPTDGSCYVVRFEADGYVAVVGYVDEHGGAFLVDRPITLPPTGQPDCAVVPDPDGHGGTVCVLDVDHRLVPRTRYRGAFTGTMREVAAHDTWHSARSLTYRPFVASMFLRFCVLDDSYAARRASAVPEIDLMAHPLGRPVDVFGEFHRVALPDAIESLLYRIAAASEPSGIERFARRVLGSIDHVRLGSLVARTGATLAYIDHMEGFYLNFERAGLSEDDIAFLYAVEAALNRILRVLQAMGFGLRPATASPCEEACSLIDQKVLRGVTEQVGRALTGAIEPNERAQPGSVACRPGGTWDVLTRFIAQCEAMRLAVRLDYDVRCDADAGIVHVRYALPAASALPDTRYDAETGAWCTVDRDERALLAREYAARMALVLGAAAFASAFRIKRCIVEQIDRLAALDAATYLFERSAFLAELAPFAQAMASAALAGAPVLHRLEAFVLHGPVPAVEKPEIQRAPGKDDRALPDDLRRLLLADDVCELEVMESPEDPDLARYEELHALSASDPAAALVGLADLVSDLEARCAAAELISDRALSSCFCESYLGRIVLPLLVDDPHVRVNRAPDALFFAQSEICSLYLQSAAYDRALPEARKLLDIAPSSARAHFMLVNVLGRMRRFDEVIEVCKHGLRVACDRGAIAYLLYRMAYAFWSLQDRETALACYRLVPEGGDMSTEALEEMRILLAEMGRSDTPDLSEASAVAQHAGIPLAPVAEVSRQIADAAVLLCDHGFPFLACRCVHHLWRMSGDDVLGALQRSLMPGW